MTTKRSDTIGIVQARLASTRLPGKTLVDIMGRPMLWHVVSRLRRASHLNDIVIATTTREEDKAIIRLAGESKIKCYAGSEDDVLDRYYQAASTFKADVIVRITADCPLIDPRVVDRVVQRFFAGSFDYVSNTLELTYPDGLDTEVFSFGALEKAWGDARRKSEREHVTPYLWKHPDKFRLANVRNDIDLSHLRWSVDQIEDLQFIREVYGRLYREGELFYMEDVLELLRKYPDLKQINQGIHRNEGYAKSVEVDQIVK